MSNARNHHYVSQFYLTNFSKSGNKKDLIHVYDKLNKKKFSTKPRNIAAKRDFNKINVEGKENIIEDLYSRFEGEIAPIFKNIIDAKKYPTIEELNYLVNYLTLLFIRNPKSRKLFDDSERASIELTLEILINDKNILKSYLDRLKIDTNKNDITYESLKQFIKDKNYTIDIAQEFHPQNELDLLDKLGPIVSSRNWYLVISSEEIGEFITSDNPTTLISTNDSLYFGLGTKNTELAFPISKYLALVGIYEAAPISKIIYATQKNVADLNGRIINQANGQIYSTNQHFYYLDIDGEIQSSIKLMKK